MSPTVMSPTDVEATVFKPRVWNCLFEIRREERVALRRIVSHMQAYANVTYPIYLSLKEKSD